MLPEVVHISDGHDAFRRDGFIVGFDALRNPRRSEFGGSLRTNSGQRGQALIRWKRLFRIRALDIGQQIVDLLGDNVGELRIANQIGSQFAGDLLAQSRYAIK